MNDFPGRTAEALESRIRAAVSGRDVAVQFSGGLDSGLVGALACRYASHATMYVAGTEGCHDIGAARSAADVLGADLEVISVAEDACRDLIVEMMKATGTADPLVLAFSAPLFCVLRDCSEGTVLTGECADEVFGGYNKYVGLPDDALLQAMDGDLERFRTVSLPHDDRMAALFGRTVERPYFSAEVRGALSGAGPKDVRPGPGDRKRILCDAAVILGFGFLAQRPKKAAQYGSGILDAVKAECRLAGMEYNEFVSGAAEANGLARHAGRPRDRCPAHRPSVKIK